MLFYFIIEVVDAARPEEENKEKKHKKKKKKEIMRDSLDIPPVSDVQEGETMVTAEVESIKDLKSDDEKVKKIQWKLGEICLVSKSRKRREKNKETSS